MEEVGKLSRNKKKERVKQAIEEAKIHRRKKRFQKGIDLLVDTLKYQIKEDQIYYRLGNIYYDAGDLDRAEYVYKRAIEKNGEHVNAHHNLSVVYKKQGRISEFVKMKKKATKLASKHPSQVKLSPKKIKWLRSWSYKMMLGMGILIAIVIGVIFLTKLF